MAIKFLSSENIAGDIDINLSKNGITYLAVTNTNTGVSANARVQVVGESSQLDIIATSAGYTGVSGWADSGIISTDSGASGGLKLNSQAGGIQLQTNATSQVIMDANGLVGIKMSPNNAVILSVSGPIGPTPGTQSDPTYTFFGDPDTGMFHSGTDTLGFTTGGTTRLSVRAAGINVIGETETDTISCSGTVTALKYVATGINSEFTHGTAWGTNLKLTNTNADASPPILTFLKNGGSPNNSDYVGFINYRMDNSNGDEFSWVELSAIAIDVTDGSEDSAYRIGTWGGGAEYPNTIIAKSGNVGIGTDSPSSRLTVNKTKSGTGVENYDLIRLGLLGTGVVGDSSTIGWFSTSGTKTAGIEGISGLDNILYGELAFHVRRYTTDAYDEVMRINNRGNVGIGNTNPGDFDDYADNLVVGTGSGHEGMTIFSGSSNYGSIYFADDSTGTARYKGWLSYLHNTERMEFGTNEATKMVIDLNGKVGIGTTSPSSYDAEGDNLVVYDAITPGITIALPQTTAAGSARGSILFSDGTSGSERYRGGVIYDHGTGMGGVADTMYLRAAVNSYLVLNALGNVGIGTKTPDAKLEIKATASTTGLTFKTTDAAGNENFFIQDGGRTGVRFYPFTIGQTSSTSAASGARFQVTTTAGDLVVMNDGKVGIGTISPERRLDVKSNSDTAPSAYLRGGKSSQGEIQNTGLIIGTQTTMVAGDYQGISFTGYTSASAIARGRAAIGVEAINGPGKMDLVFMTRFADDGTQLTSADEKMRIDSSGMVGIGIIPGNGFGLARLSLGTGAVANEIIAFASASGGNAEFRNTSSTGTFTFTNADGASQKMRITSGGNVIIGTETSTACTLKVSSTKNGSSSSPHFCITGTGYTALHWLDTNAYNIVTNSASRDIEIRANTNGVILTPGATAWASNSDIALKENINPLENVLDKIKDYKCVEYNLKNSPEDKKIGFIAQDWLNDFSAIINKDKNDMLSMKYTETIPVLLKAIQELTTRVKELENK